VLHSTGALQKEWADPELDGTFAPQWNALDGKINRASHEVGPSPSLQAAAPQGEYLVAEGRPLNVRGRTGLAGRGVLGKSVERRWQQ
jgi:hypothetical protein